MRHNMRAAAQETPLYSSGTALLSTSANVNAGTITPEVSYDICNSESPAALINGTIIPSQKLKNYEGAPLSYPCEHRG